MCFPHMWPLAPARWWGINTQISLVCDFSHHQSWTEKWKLNLLHLVKYTNPCVIFLCEKPGLLLFFTVLASNHVWLSPSVQHHAVIFKPVKSGSVFKQPSLRSANIKDNGWFHSFFILACDIFASQRMNVERKGGDKGDTNVRRVFLLKTEISCVYYHLSSITQRTLLVKKLPVN